MTGQPHTSRRQAAALLLGSVAFSVAALELGCRLVGVQAPRLYRTDSDRGWTLKSNVRTHWSQEGSAPVHTNSQGYRDSEWALVKEPGVLRIAVLGDSFTEALQVPLEQTWVNQLPAAMAAVPGCRLLKGFPKGAETLNFGVGGYGTGQSWLTWQKDAQRFQPQVVLHAVYFENDLRDNIKSERGSGSGPTFSLHQGNLNRSDAFRSSPDYRFRQSFAGRLSDWVLSWSRLAQLINQLKNLHNARAGEECDAAGCTFFPLGPDGTKLYGQDPADLRQGWEVFWAILKTWKQEAQVAGSQLVVTSVTTPPQLWPKPEDRQAEINKHGLDWFKPEKQLGAVLKADGIPYLPLAQDLQQQADEQGLIAHGFAGQKPGPGYGHWNREGHKAAATVLARKLCSLDLPLING
ncbi:SGNH/GDSL hydrolase family protein [Synechococcus sp. A10-1-5-1]|uniref:SGNH/GDSL hydrolase family protein n=1 Tax=Synechococcus sp. A10-1-5-1 TaxID=2936507 RepID=UPI002000D8F1|nr:SGNH/GDSL hydrolase family protein [Synechococcus sp. A10-1-5-1]UPM49240.1 SGNH/GDSL hydrolase family protein [Synechococcus sp. A10-1-5-1]